VVYYTALHYTTLHYICIVRVIICMIAKEEEAHITHTHTHLGVYEGAVGKQRRLVTQPLYCSGYDNNKKGAVSVCTCVSVSDLNKQMWYFDFALVYHILL
jgi:hypothetical protein